MILALHTSDFALATFTTPAAAPAAIARMPVVSRTFDYVGLGTRRMEILKNPEQGVLQPVSQRGRQALSGVAAAARPVLLPSILQLLQRLLDCATDLFLCRDEGL